MPSRRRGVVCIFVCIVSAARCIISLGKSEGVFFLCVCCCMFECTPAAAASLAPHQHQREKCQEPAQFNDDGNSTHTQAPVPLSLFFTFDGEEQVSRANLINSRQYQFRSGASEHKNYGAWMLQYVCGGVL
jgi:hypothetical protein